MPSVRRRFVSAKVRSKWRASNEPESAVSWWTMTSGAACGDGAADGVGVERVGDHGRGAEVAHQTPLGGAAGHPGDVVAGRDQARDELAAEGAGRAGD